MLTKNQIAVEIEDRTGVKPALAKRVMDTLADLAAEEIKSGEKFTVPGIGTIDFKFQKGRKKGEKYTGFMGQEQVAEKTRPAKITGLRMGLHPSIKRSIPKLNSKAGKAIAERKG